MKKVLAMPPREKPHSEAEIAGYNETRDREAEGVKGTLLSLVATAGVPAMWTRALGAVVPIAADAAGQVVKAIHPESPGGVGITRAELRAIAKREAAKLEAALFEAFVDAITDDEPERKRAGSRSGKTLVEDRGKPAAITENPPSGEGDAA